MLTYQICVLQPIVDVLPNLVFGEAVALLNLPLAGQDNRDPGHGAGRECTAEDDAVGGFRSRAPRMLRLCNAGSASLRKGRVSLSPAC